MIVDSQDFIKRLENIGCNPNIVLALADRFLTDQTEGLLNKVITFPNDNNRLKEYEIFFRFDYEVGNLSIFVVKEEDKEESMTEPGGQLIYTDFYKTINTLAH